VTHLLSEESQKEMGVIGPCPKEEGMARKRGSSELAWEPRGKKYEKSQKEMAGFGQCLKLEGLRLSWGG
jgi:hypothetical protein